MIHAHWKSTIRTENFSFRRVTLNQNPRGWYRFSRYTLVLVIWARLNESLAWRLEISNWDYWPQLFRGFWLRSLNSERLRAKDWTLSRNVRFIFLSHHVSVYGILCLFIDMNSASEFWFNRMCLRNARVHRTTVKNLFARLWPAHQYLRVFRFGLDHFTNPDWKHIHVTSLRQKCYFQQRILRNDKEHISESIFAGLVLLITQKLLHIREIQWDFLMGIYFFHNCFNFATPWHQPGARKLETPREIFTMPILNERFEQKRGRTISQNETFEQKEGGAIHFTSMNAGSGSWERSEKGWREWRKRRICAKCGQ